MIKSFGVLNQRSLDSAEEIHIEELEIKGYTIVKNVLSEQECADYRASLDILNQNQKDERGEDLLNQLTENNMVRLPLAKDERFMYLVNNPTILGIVKKMIGNFVTLHLQNGIVNMPSQEHHQSSWHRDLPYQDFIISKPIAISVLYCLDDFNEKTGGTFVLPHSHKIDHMPSVDYISRNEIQSNAKAGDVIVFDSMIYHRAGYNSSGNIRRGINHMYTIPLIKQQINLPATLEGRYSDDPELAMVLGYTSMIPDNVETFIKGRIQKLAKV